MAYTFADLKTKLQTQIGDPNLNDSVLSDAINYTEQSIFNTFDLTLNSDRQTNSVTSGTNTLASALPTDFQRIANIVVSSPPANLKEYYLTPEKFRLMFPVVNTSGTLSYWTFWESVEFSVLAAANYTVTIDYIKSVPILSATSDIPTIPQSFEELLILGAKMRIYEQKEDFDYSSQFTNRYADLLEAFVTRYGTRQVDYQVTVPNRRTRV